MREADIIIAAAGQAQMIKKSWVKKGAALIDVGTNPVEDKTKKSGFRLVGDCDFEECKDVAGAITPVGALPAARSPSVRLPSLPCHALSAPSAPVPWPHGACRQCSA